MKASDLFIRCLEEEGIEYIFGVPGEENADIMISLLDSKIKFVVCRHEQGAAFIADVYGRLTGKPACCLGTLGPGATNLLTGVGDANMDRAPLIVLTGQGSTTRLHKESHQATDLVRIFAECVKWGTSIHHPDSIPEIVRKAVRIATTDKFGATHIDLPENVAHMQTLARPIPPQRVPRAAPSPEAVAHAAGLIRKAKFPIILSGNGVFRAKGSDEVRAFVHETGIPIVNTFMGKGVVPTSDERYLFTVGLGSRDFPAIAIERADCVIAIGFDMVEYHPRSWNRGNEKDIIHVDMSPAEIDENYRTSAEVIGDIGRSVEALRRAVEGMAQPATELYSDLRTQMQGEFSEYENDEGFPVKPQRILCDVRKVLDQRDVVLSDVGAHKMWIARHFHTDEPNTVMISNGWCSMGFALPGAIGAKMAYPDRRVLAICGDGGVMMNIQDLETAVREGLNIVVMVWTDSQYGLIKWKQTAAFGRHSHIDFTNPDWMKLADAFGMAGFKVEKTADLPGALSEAFACGRPALVEVPVDYAENMKLTGRLKEIPFEQFCNKLDSVDLFKAIPENSRRALAESMDEVSFPAGQTVFSRGDPSDNIYVIWSGRAKIEKEGAGIAEVGPGEAFGEMAALTSDSRMATVTATEDLVCGMVTGDEFRELIQGEPDIALQLACKYAKRLKES